MPRAWPSLLGPALRLLLALAAAGLLFAADAGSKGWAETELRRRGSRSLLDGHLVLRYQTNSGIAFGLFQAHLHPRKRVWLITYSSAVTAGLTVLLAWRLLMVRPARPGQGEPEGEGEREDQGEREGQGSARAGAPVGVAALILMLAGTVGNLRDRIARGAVIDFIDVEPWRGAGWPTFNLADAYLAVGVALGLWALLASPPGRGKRTIPP